MQHKCGETNLILHLIETCNSSHPWQSSPTMPWNESSLTNKICRLSNLIKFLSTFVDLSQAINASSASLLVILRKLWFFFFLSALYFFFFFFFWTGLTRVIWLVGLINVGTIQSHGLAWKEKKEKKRESLGTHPTLYLNP